MTRYYVCKAVTRWYVCKTVTRYYVCKTVTRCHVLLIEVMLCIKVIIFIKFKGCNKLNMSSSHLSRYSMVLLSNLFIRHYIGAYINTSHGEWVVYLSEYSIQ